MELYIQMLNIVLDIELERRIDSYFEYSGEYRPGGPNIELYIWR